MKRCVVIANNGAGSFSRERLDKACRQLTSGGIKVEQLFCSDFGSMTTAAARISAAVDAPLIIAAGGDGTINAVFNGLAGNNAACAIIPMGTANVLAIELSLLSAETAVERIIAGNFRPLTAGVIRNKHRTSRFFLMAGAGIDGAVVRGVTQGLKSRFGKGAYLLSALRNLVSWESGELLVTTEEQQFSCHSIITCNAVHYGGSFRLAPEASLFAPVFELIAVTDVSRRGVIALAAAAVSGQENRYIKRLTAGRLQISGAKPVQIDGDSWGDTPIEIVAEPNYLNLIT